MTAEADLERLKREYAGRQVRLAQSEVYSTFNLSYLFAIHQRQKALIHLLRPMGIRTLSEMRVLEIGCGHGDVIHEMSFHRLPSNNIHGVEILPDRLAYAKTRFPGTNLATADGQNLPYPANAFDIVLQFTVLSSILDNNIKSNIAREMLRVIKPGGVIIWYDFWLNPANRQTKGIRKSEIRRLFPECTFTFKRVTLAPPIARRLIPVSWTLGTLLEKLVILNTHLLVAIRPQH